MTILLEGPLDASPSRGGRGVFSVQNGFCSGNRTFQTAAQRASNVPVSGVKNGLCHGVSWRHFPSLFGAGVVLGLVLGLPLSSCVTWGVAFNVPEPWFPYPIDGDKNLRTVVVETTRDL